MPHAWRHRRRRNPVENLYCRILGITVPDLASVKDHREANTYSLLIVALLERGEPMTLAEVAERFSAAGVASRDRAHLSLTRCKPARAPVYRDGDRYALDIHDDDELGLWLFRLGLRPPQVLAPRPVREAPPPRPPPDERLTTSELDLAWKGGLTWSWSAQRIAIAILDAHGGAMPGADVIAFAAARDCRRLSLDSADYWRAGAPVRSLADGRWVLDAAHPAVAGARTAVRDRVELEHRWARLRPAPGEIEANQRAWEGRRAARAAELVRLRRLVVHAFPVEAPEAVVLVDVSDRSLESHVAAGDPDWLGPIRERLATCDVIAAPSVREVLRGLGFDPCERRLADLVPPQKSLRLNRRGRTLKITLAMLVQGSCGISRPLAEPGKLLAYRRSGDRSRLLRRMEADVKSLFWLYEYGRLHGGVRLRWGFLDEMFGAPWSPHDETHLRDLCKLAVELGVHLEVVAGSAPGWADPWARMRRCRVERDRYDYLLWDDEGRLVDNRDVQLARLEAVERTVH
jgi:hypothetical protein